jgi:hypothetical protein
MQKSRMQAIQQANCEKNQIPVNRKKTNIRGLTIKISESQSKRKNLNPSPTLKQSNPSPTVKKTNPSPTVKKNPNPSPTAKSQATVKKTKSQANCEKKKKIPVQL